MKQLEMIFMTKIFDLHADTISLALNSNKNIYKNDLHIDLMRGMEIDEWVQTFALFIEDKYIDNGALNYFKRQYNFFKEQTNKYLDFYNDFLKTKKIQKNKCNYILSVEGGSMLEGNIENIDELLKRNIKIFTLTWNGENEIAGGVCSKARLKPFGKDVIKRLQENNIIVDVSHLNQNSFYDVANISTRPIIATHSNSKKICNNKRNLTDEQVKYIIDNNGLIGINYYTYFVNGENECTIDEMCNHMEHILSLGGEHILCLGSDFDGANVSSQIKDIKGVEKLYNSMIKYFKKDIADKIIFENAHNFFTNTFI